MCFRYLLPLFLFLSSGSVYADASTLRLKDLFPYSSSDTGRFTLKYDSLSSSGGEYDLSSGSLDFYYSLSLINEFDVNKSMSEQDYIDVRGVVPYDIASKASFFFQTEMNTTLRSKIDRKNILDAYRVVNLDFVKRDTEVKSSGVVVGEIKATIEESLMLPNDVPSPGLSLYMAAALTDMQASDSGLHYAFIKDVVGKSNMLDYMDVSVLLYCKGRSLKRSTWFDITSLDSFPREFPQVCMAFEQRALFHAVPKVEKILAMGGSALSLEEALMLNGFNLNLRSEYLTQQYGKKKSRRVKRTYLSENGEDGKVFSATIMDAIGDIPFSSNSSLAMSMIEQGLVNSSDLIKSADYAALLDRQIGREEALASLLMPSSDITIIDDEWRNCTSNHFIDFEHSCASVNQEVYIGWVPSALDIAEGDISPLHAYYLNWYLSKGLITSLEARSFLDKYSEYLKATR